MKELQIIDELDKNGVNRLFATLETDEKDFAMILNYGSECSYKTKEDALKRIFYSTLYKLDYGWENLKKPLNERLYNKEMKAIILCESCNAHFHIKGNFCPMCGEKTVVVDTSKSSYCNDVARFSKCITS